MVNDPIGDFINRLKTAQAAGKKRISVPHSAMKHAIAKKLHERRFLSGVEVETSPKKAKVLVVSLAYAADGSPRIRDAVRVSRPGRRLYGGVSEMRPVQHGTGLLLVSTPSGILTGDEARKTRVGGELLFKIW